MSKKIRLTPDELAKIRAEFEEALKRVRICDGSVTFTKTFSASETARAKLNVTASAWEKMCALVREFDVEVAWHGLVRRVEGEGNSYEVYDVIVEPQKVTGATVDTDDKEYQPWLNNQPDEVFNALRLRGHSHVNMSVSPSQTDIKMWSEIVSQLDGDLFYIFMILNKRGEKTIRIYDMASDIFFDTADVDLTVGGEDISGFIANAKTLVKRNTPITASGCANYGSGYSAYGGNYSGGYNYGAYNTPKTNAVLPPAKEPENKPEEKKEAAPPQKEPAAKKFNSNAGLRKGTPRKVYNFEKYLEEEDDDYGIYD